MRKKINVNDFLWAQLPPDLLIDVFSRLGSIEQLAFRGVCKTWRSAAKATPREHVKRLWLMMKANSSYIYIFVDYSSSTPSTNRPSLIRKLPSLYNCSILTAKHRWLLMSKQTMSNVIETFFYEPFSCKSIQLPTFTKLYWPFQHDLSQNRLQIKFDFTGPPTSPECTVVAVFYCAEHGWLHTTTCRRGQAAWAPSAVYQSFNSVWLAANMMVFHEGSFYCISSKNSVGKVLAFHPATNTIKSFVGHPRQVELCNFATSTKEVLCDRLEPAAAVELVEKLGGDGFLSMLHNRQRREPLNMSRIPKVEGSVIPLGEIEVGYPNTYQPFLQMEEGQLLILYHLPHYLMMDRVWINKRWMHPGPGQCDLEWVSSNSQAS